MAFIEIFALSIVPFTLAMRKLMFPLTARVIANLTITSAIRSVSDQTSNEIRQILDSGNICPTRWAF